MNSMAQAAGMIPSDYPIVALIVAVVVGLALVAYHHIHVKPAISAAAPPAGAGSGAQIALVHAAVQEVGEKIDLSKKVDDLTSKVGIVSTQVANAHNDMVDLRATVVEGHGKLDEIKGKLDEKKQG